MNLSYHLWHSLLSCPLNYPFIFAGNEKLHKINSLDAATETRSLAFALLRLKNPSPTTTDTYSAVYSKYQLPPFSHSCISPLNLSLRQILHLLSAAWILGDTVLLSQNPPNNKDSEKILHVTPKLYSKLLLAGNQLLETAESSAPLLYAISKAALHLKNTSIALKTNFTTYNYFQLYAYLRALSTSISPNTRPCDAFDKIANQLYSTATPQDLDCNVKVATPPSVFTVASALPETSSPNHFQLLHTVLLNLAALLAGNTIALCDQPPLPSYPKPLQQLNRETLLNLKPTNLILSLETFSDLAAETYNRITTHLSKKNLLPDTPLNTLPNNLAKPIIETLRWRLGGHVCRIIVLGTIPELTNHLRNKINYLHWSATADLLRSIGTNLLLLSGFDDCGIIFQEHQFLNSDESYLATLLAETPYEEGFCASCGRPLSTLSVFEKDSNLRIIGDPLPHPPQQSSSFDCYPMPPFFHRNGSIYLLQGTFGKDPEP